MKLSVKNKKSEEPIIKSNCCTVKSSHWSAQLWVLGDIHTDLTGTVQKSNQEIRNCRKWRLLWSISIPVCLLPCWSILWPLLGTGSVISFYCLPFFLFVELCHQMGSIRYCGMRELSWGSSWLTFHPLDVQLVPFYLNVIYRLLLKLFHNIHVEKIHVSVCVWH